MELKYNVRKCKLGLKRQLGKCKLGLKCQLGKRKLGLKYQLGKCGPFEQFIAWEGKIPQTGGSHRCSPASSSWGVLWGQGGWQELLRDVYGSVSGDKMGAGVTILLLHHIDALQKSFCLLKSLPKPPPKPSLDLSNSGPAQEIGISREFTSSFVLSGEFGLSVFLFPFHLIYGITEVGKAL